MRDCDLKGGVSSATIFKITFCFPHEVLHQCISYRYMAIEEDKHVNIMFDRMEKMAHVNVIELYISVGPHAEVGGKEVQ